MCAINLTVITRRNARAVDLSAETAADGAVRGPPVLAGFPIGAVDLARRVLLVFYKMQINIVVSNEPSDYFI